ncbi:hypothetical protein [Sphingomonas sp. VNH70]|uniref:hypothetical protein n=1 Tax=Sphingomonas silueang TaxID=3156617 RepID=UPI0032B47C2D
MAADPRPANDSAAIGPSLFDRAVGAARPRPAPDPAPNGAPRRPADRAAIATALLLVAGPLATWLLATLWTGEVRRETAALAARAAPRIAARMADARARAMLAATWDQPTLGTTVETIARALPPEAGLLRVERPADGALRLEVATPDPERLAAALRREGALGHLRTAAQTPGDGGMRVTLEEPR